MDNAKLVRKWHKKWHKTISKLCRERLGRNLTLREEQLITSRCGFMALEMIEDTVKSLAGGELEKYLNSEPGK
jgi:hypothetical protein